MKKQDWLQKHAYNKGSRIVSILRYNDPNKLLQQIFGGEYPDGYAVLTNTPTKIELTFEGELEYILTPVEFKPCSIFRVGDTVKHRDRPQNILHQYTGTVVSIEPTAHGCDYIGVEINKVRFFMSTDLTH